MMIYRLNDEFTKVEEKDGVMQNKSCHAMIEIVTTDGTPEKDTGISLKPREKLAFSVENGKSLYARCECLEFSGANLAVVNFKKPASGGEGAGGAVGSIVYGHFVLPGYVKAAGQLLKRDDYPALYACAIENNLVLSEADWANGMQGMYAEGDGVDTFRVPDLRGQFLRGLDDSAGIDTGRILGSKQEDTLQGHWHHTNTANTSGKNPDFILLVPERRASYEGTILAKSLASDGVNGIPRVSYETRPINIALIAQIKY